MRNSGSLARDDAWRRGLIERLDAIEATAAADAPPSPPDQIAAAPQEPPSIDRLVERLAAVPEPGGKPAEQPLAFEELQNSLAEALAPKPQQQPLNVEAALSAVTSELGRIAFGAPRPVEDTAPRLAASASSDHDTLPLHDEAIALPQAILPDRPDVSRARAPRAPIDRGYFTFAAMSVAAGAALVVLGAGAFSYRALPSLQADATSMRRPAPTVIAAGPGRFEAHFSQAAEEAPRAPAPAGDIAAVEPPAAVAVVVEGAAAAVNGSHGMAPLQIMAMTPVEPAAAPLPPIPKAPDAAPARRPAKAQAPVVAKRPLPAPPRKAPGEPEKKSAPAPTQIAADPATLRPVPRAPRPTGVFTLGGPPPAAIGTPSQEYRVNIPAGPPAWLPKPDQ